MIHDWTSFEVLPLYASRLSLPVPKCTDGRGWMGPYSNQEWRRQPARANDGTDARSVTGVLAPAQLRQGIAIVAISGSSVVTIHALMLKRTKARRPSSASVIGSWTVRCERQRSRLGCGDGNAHHVRRRLRCDVSGASHSRIEAWLCLHDFG